MIPRITSRKQQPTTFGYPKGVNAFTHLGGLRGMTQTAAKAPSAPTTPFAPTGSSAASIGSTPSIPQADPRDAQYFNDVAKLDQYYSTQSSNLTASGQELARNLTKNNSLLAEQQPKDELASKQNANKSGLFYSGALGKNLGDIAESYARRRSDLQTGYESSKGSLDRQMADLNANYGPNGLMRNDALASGIGRASASDQTNALALAAQQSASPAAPASVPYSTQPGTSRAGVPGTWHIYPGGRKVFVARR